MLAGRWCQYQTTKLAIRLPLQTVLDTTITDNGSGSVAGGWAFPFKIPQDTDNVVVKFSPSVTAAGMSITFQTSDDGGTTYYDVARTSIASNSGATAVAGSRAQWLTVPVVVGAPRNVTTGSLIAAGSLVSAVFNGNAAASTLLAGQNSGLPILGIQNRVFGIMTGDSTANGSRVQVMVNSQSATA